GRHQGRPCLGTHGRRLRPDLCYSWSLPVSPCRTPQFPHRPVAFRRSSVAVRAALTGLVLAVPAGQALAAGDDALAATDLDAVLVVAQRAERVSNGATNLD